MKFEQFKVLTEYEKAVILLLEEIRDLLKTGAEE